MTLSVRELPVEGNRAPGNPPMGYFGAAAGLTFIDNRDVTDPCVNLALEEVEARVTGLGPTDAR